MCLALCNPYTRSYLQLEVRESPWIVTPIALRIARRGSISELPSSSFYSWGREVVSSYGIEWRRFLPQLYIHEVANWMSIKFVRVWPCDLFLTALLIETDNEIKNIITTLWTLLPSSRRCSIYVQAGQDLLPCRVRSPSSHWCSALTLLRCKVYLLLRTNAKIAQKRQEMWSTWCCWKGTQEAAGRFSIARLTHCPSFLGCCFLYKQVVLR